MATFYFQRNPFLKGTFQQQKQKRYAHSEYSLSGLCVRQERTAGLDTPQTGWVHLIDL